MFREEDVQNEKEGEAVKNKRHPGENRRGGAGVFGGCHASESIQPVQSCLVTSGRPTLLNKGLLSLC